MESNEEISEKLDVVLRSLKTAKEEREIFEKHVVTELNSIKHTLRKQKKKINDMHFLLL